MSVKCKQTERKKHSLSCLNFTGYIDEFEARREVEFQTKAIYERLDCLYFEMAIETVASLFQGNDVRT